MSRDKVRAIEQASEQINSGMNVCEENVNDSKVLKSEEKLNSGNLEDDNDEEELLVDGKASADLTTDEMKILQISSSEQIRENKTMQEVKE